MELIQKREKVGPGAAKVAELCEEGRSVQDAVDVVSEECNVTKSALMSQFYRSYTIVDKHRSVKKLTLEEESLLVALLYAFSRNDCGLTARDLIEVVKLVFNKDVSKTWISRFLKSKKETLSFRQSVFLGKSRAKHERTQKTRWRRMLMFSSFQNLEIANPKRSPATRVVLKVHHKGQ